MSEDSPRQQPPPSSPSHSDSTPSRTRSPSPEDDEQHAVHSTERDGSAPPPVDEESVPPTTANNASAAPPSTAQQPPKAHKTAKHRKSRSASPLPAINPPPLATIRLEIKLGGPSHYEVDIATLALDAGQIEPTPAPFPKHDTSESEEESDRPAAKSSETAPKKRKRTRNTEYDLADPFIDDSELGIDDRTHFAQTKQKGFYVSSGEVALLTDKSPKKPRSSRPLNFSLSSAATANIQPLSQTISRPRTPTSVKPLEGTRDSPIYLVDDEETKTSLKRARSITPPPGDVVQEPDSARKRTKKARPPPSTDGVAIVTSTSAPPSRSHKHAANHRFSDELEASFDALKVAIAEENWEVKGKFPPSIKPKLQQLALQAIVLGEYNEHFFARMPTLFPYNKFTMTKLIKRLVYNDHHRLLTTRQDELLAELKSLTDAGFEQAKAEWERNVQNWKERQSKGAAGGAPDSTGQPDEGDDHDDPDKETKEGATGTSASAKDKEPSKRYRLTDKMKLIFWQLYCLSNECSRLTNEKNQLEGIPDLVSEQGMRKGLYQKIISAFPEGWMTSGNISRDISVIKKKHESEQSRYDDYSWSKQRSLAVRLENKESYVGSSVTCRSLN